MDFTVSLFVLKLNCSILFSFQKQNQGAVASAEGSALAKIGSTVSAFLLLSLYILFWAL